MTLTLEQARKLKNARILVLAGLVVGPLYTLFSDGFGPLFPYLNSTLVGVSVALIVSFSEFILFTGSWRKLAFHQLLLLRAGLYSVSIVGVIFLVVAFSRMLRDDASFREVFRSADFQAYLHGRDFMASCLYAMTMVILTIFILQIRRKIGPEILRSFITGRYYRPRAVERIVMFIDIPHGKTIIERIGRIAYFRYLNDILYDITETILYHHAHIYEYVDSTILLTWNLPTGIENANCVRTFFEMNEALEARKIFYYETYGFIPELRASLHCGTVIRGEIGDVKSDVKYHGDVMNTTARILGKTDAEHTLLLSANLLRQLELPVLYQAEPLGTFELKGKHHAVELFHLRENENLY